MKLSTYNNVFFTDFNKGWVNNPTDINLAERILLAQ